MFPIDSYPSPVMMLFGNGIASFFHPQCERVGIACA